MTTRLYVIGILCIGTVAGFLLDLTVELTGHPWWFLLMMLICALSPGPVAFAVAIDGTDHIINLRSRLSLPGWIKPIIILLLVVLTLGVIGIAGINPRAYAYVPLLLPIIASSILFGFGYGLLALIAGTLAADYPLNRLAATSELSASCIPRWSTRQYDTSAPRPIAPISSGMAKAIAKNTLPRSSLANSQRRSSVQMPISANI
jgi:hypothetical protein